MKRNYSIAVLHSPKLTKKRPRCRSCGQPLRRVLNRPAILRRLSELDWTRGKLAERMGVTNSYVSQLLRPTLPIQITEKRLLPLAQILHLPVAALLELELDAVLRGELENLEKVRKANRLRARRKIRTKERKAAIKAALYGPDPEPLPPA